METPVEWLQIYNLIALVLFSVAISIGAVMTMGRLLRYLHSGQRPPRLLWRDVIARLSLALPFVAILTVRALGAFGIDTSTLVADPRWIVPTSAFAVFGAWLYVYYEIFVIESPGIREELDRLRAMSERDQPPHEPPHL